MAQILLLCIRMGRSYVVGERRIRRIRSEASVC